MKDRFKFLLASVSFFFLLLAVMSAFLTLIFRDVRTGPLGAYLTGYLWPRFMDLFMIFAPLGAAVLVIGTVGWLIYELTLERKP